MHRSHATNLETPIPTRRCAICLDNIVDACESQPCHHQDFDFLCLITWLQLQPSCPLCKVDVHQVRYDFSKNNPEGKVYDIPKPPPNISGKSTPIRWPSQDSAIQRRRFVYRNNLYSRHVGSNSRQSAASAYRELSPQSFLTDPELISRARVWLGRELRVFQFLTTTDHASVPGRNYSNRDDLLEYVIAILKAIDIQDSTGQAENIIRDFLGRRFSQHLLHELKSWLRSPDTSLSEWDFNIQYDGMNPNTSEPQNMADRIVQNPNAPTPRAVLKYSEPPEARKPPPTRAWRLYVFKDDAILNVIQLWERSVWLLGRDEIVVDVVTPHPSCSGQHAVLQFRYIARKSREEVGEEQMTSGEKTCVRLFLMDLDSSNGTILNGKRVEKGRYLELGHKDVIRLGGSSRDYVLILP